MAVRLCWMLGLLTWPGVILADVAAPSFSRDVLPALTKAGCNSGACHGSFQGRGGMQLSLLGYDSLADFETLFLTGRGRRVSAVAPTDSLLLRKASGRMPHGGGLRLRPESVEYQLLHDYIAQGMVRPTAAEPVVQTLIVSPDKLTLNAGGRLACC